MALICDQYVTLSERKKMFKFAQKSGMSTLRLRFVRPVRTWILLRERYRPDRRLAGEKGSHVLHRLVPTTTVDTRMAVLSGSR